MAGAGWLVVYGSLMRGLPATGTDAVLAARPGESAAAGAVAERPGDLLDRLGAGAGLRRVGPCRVPGILFDLGPYPALRPARSAADQVRGELHAILDPAVLAVLDAFEGFDPADPAGSDYLRASLRVIEPTVPAAWVYVFNREPDPARRIASGDWRAHLAERAASAHDPVSRRR